MSRRPTRTERRRSQLAVRIGVLEAMERRSLITESLGIFTAGIGVPAAVLVGRVEAEASTPATDPPTSAPAESAWPSIPARAATGGGPSSPPGPGPAAAVIARPVVASPTTVAIRPSSRPVGSCRR